MGRTVIGFCRDQSGATSVILAVVLVPLLCVAGLALDFSRGLHTKSKIQDSLDAAVLAGASSRVHSADLDPVVAAQNTFTGQKLDSNVAATFTNDNGIVRGSATFIQKNMLAQLMGFAATPINVESAATNNPAHAPACIMAMHPTRKHTLELNDRVSVIAPKCHIYGNSDNDNDVADPHTAQNFLTGASVQAIGFGHHFIENISPPLEHAPELIPDPLDALPIPFGNCDHQNIAIAGGAQTLQPGVYCGGLKVSAGATVTLSPGVYVIRGGLFDVANATVLGQGVTIGLSDTGAKINWQQATIHLEAPRSGTYTGMVIVGARIPAQHAITNSELDIYGVVYMPNGELTWENSGDYTPKAKWTVWITDGFSWLGSGTIHVNFDIDKSDVPYPFELMSIVPRPGSVRLVDTTAGG